MSKNYVIAKYFDRNRYISPIEIKDWNNLFFSKDVGDFFYYLFTLIIDGDSYTLEGPDEEAKMKFKEQIEFWGNALPIPFYGQSETMRWDGDEPVSFDDERFSYAVENTASMEGYVYCPDRYQLVEVHSREEAEKYLEEYRRNEEEIQKSRKVV